MATWVLIPDSVKLNREAVQFTMGRDDDDNSFCLEHTLKALEQDGE